jgi:hypothetical protein
MTTEWSVEKPFPGGRYPGMTGEINRLFEVWAMA